MLRVYVKLNNENLDSMVNRTEEVCKAIANDVVRSVTMTLNSLVRDAVRNGVKPSEQLSKELADRFPECEPVHKTYEDPDAKVAVRAGLDSEYSHEQAEEYPNE